MHLNQAGALPLDLTINFAILHNRLGACWSQGRVDIGVGDLEGGSPNRESTFLLCSCK